MKQTQTRPITFVAHSLGGIVHKTVSSLEQAKRKIECWPKQTFIHSEATRQGALEEQREIKISTYGMFTYGNPALRWHGVHLGELMLNLASIFVTTNDRIPKNLERDSEWLQQQLGQYAPISGEFITKFAYGTYPTPIIAGKRTMVSNPSILFVSAALWVASARDDEARRTQG